MKEKVYETHRECALNGYYKAHEFIAQMPKEQVEDNRTFIKFWCLPQKVKTNEEAT